MTTAFYPFGWELALFIINHLPRCRLRNRERESDRNLMTTLHIVGVDVHIDSDNSVVVQTWRERGQRI